jgi:hypothetical protein
MQGRRTLSRVRSLSCIVSMTAAAGLAAVAPFGSSASSPTQRSVELKDRDSVLLRGYGVRCSSFGTRAEPDFQCTSTTHGDPVVFMRGIGEYRLMIGTWQPVSKSRRSERVVYRFAPGKRDPGTTVREPATAVLRPGDVLRFRGLPQWHCLSRLQPASVQCRGGTEWVLTITKDGFLTVSTVKAAKRVAAQPRPGWAYVWK